MLRHQTNWCIYKVIMELKLYLLIVLIVVHSYFCLSSMPACPFNKYPKMQFSKTKHLPPEWTLRVGLWRTNSVCSCNQPCARRAPWCSQDWEGQCNKRYESTALCNQEKPVPLARLCWDASAWRVCTCHVSDV